MAPAALQHESYVFDPRPDFPLRLTAKRYWHPATATEAGLTVILSHGTSFMKESWEPTLEEFYALGGGRGIREMWSIDCPNHGEAVFLNESILQYGYSDMCMLQTFF